MNLGSSNSSQHELINIGSSKPQFPITIFSGCGAFCNKLLVWGLGIEGWGFLVLPLLLWDQLLPQSGLVLSFLVGGIPVVVLTIAFLNRSIT